MRRIIMVGGWAHNDASLRAVAARLAPGSAVEALSTAALGLEGPAPSGPLQGISHYARALRQHVEAGGDSCVLVAWSMGAIIALEMAGACEAAVSKLIVISATARFCRGPDYACGISEQSVRAMLLGLKRSPERTLGQFIRDVVHPGQLSELALRLRVGAALEMGVDELMAGLRYLRETDLRERVGALDIPVLVLHGTEDRIVPSAAGAELCRLLPHGRLKLYEGAGHNLVIDHPDGLAQEMAGFMGADT